MREFQLMSARIAALLLTAIIGFVTLVLGVPYRAGIDPLVRRLWRNPWGHMPRLWAECIEWICNRGILGGRTIITEVVAPVRAGESLICIANHPLNDALPALVWYLGTRIAPRVRVVAKQEHARNPLFGWPLWATGAPIFIDRTNGQAAFRSIRRGVGTSDVGRSVMLIFPDTHRPTDERIRVDRRRHISRINDIDRWLRHTLMPRAGGLAELVKNLPCPVRVINITVAFDQKHRITYIHSGETNITHRFTAHELREWLTNEWRLKNAQIDTWFDIADDTAP